MNLFLLQYLYWKAATVIQNQYRTYCEHKRFKKSQEAAICIQNCYRTYKEHKGNCMKVVIVSVAVTE